MQIRKTLIFLLLPLTLAGASQSFEQPMDEKQYAERRAELKCLHEARVDAIVSSVEYYPEDSFLVRRERARDNIYPHTSEDLEKILEFGDTALEKKDWSDLELALRLLGQCQNDPRVEDFATSVLDLSVQAPVTNDQMLTWITAYSVAAWHWSPSGRERVISILRTGLPGLKSNAEQILKPEHRQRLSLIAAAFVVWNAPVDEVYPIFLAVG